MERLNCCTPVLFLIFNRPDLTQRVFERIREARPRQLFIAADGPRSDVPNDQEMCAHARQIIDMVDWECEIYTLFREKNLGCKRAVSSAIDWFFEHVEEGIILEDDTLPDQSFFRFCEELLERYRDEPRVAAISGSHPFDDDVEIEESYFFSRYNRIWGWATWRRAWEFNDVDIKFWPELKAHGGHYSFFYGPEEAKYYENIWDRCYRDEIDTWDYQWFLSKLLHFSCTAVSAKNLVSNIGFGPEATHTHNVNDLANYPSEELDFPLTYPSGVYINYGKDLYIHDLHRAKQNSKGSQKRILKIMKRFPRVLSRSLKKALASLQ